MQRFKKIGFWRTAMWSALGILAVALFTLIAFRLHLSFTSAGFCFLVLLVLPSLSGELIASAIVAIMAVGCLDYFFVEPLFSFQVDSPLDTLGLTSFLVIALVITRLVSQVRIKTEASRLQHENLKRLYDVAQQMLALEPDATAGGNFLEPFRQVFGLKAVCLFDAARSELYLAGQAHADLEKKTGEAFIHGQGGHDRAVGITTQIIRVGGRTTGAIGFEGLRDQELTAGPLAALAIAHLERTHSFAHASRAAATAQAESYRSVILDALAHEFKTPLSTILAAAGALREVRSLSPDHREMAETVESEAARLGRLTTRLIRTARLEREEVKPWMELIDVSSVVSDTVDQYNKSAYGRISVVRECESTEVLADRELLRLAVSQLLDNACKYSTPGSAVVLSIARQDESIALRVLSSGNPIPPGEKSKIFDRFYRGLNGRNSSHGSGLGLYVARKIAVALGGNLDLDSELGVTKGAAFCLTLPVPESERRDIPAVV
jgi:two-component system, OmpR family, sensor histidine kinase KdpD